MSKTRQTQCLLNNPKEKTILLFYSVTSAKHNFPENSNTTWLSSCSSYYFSEEEFFPFCIKPPHTTAELEDVGLSVYRLFVDQYINSLPKTSTFPAH